MKKKFLSLFLSIVMVLGMIVPVSADTVESTDADAKIETQVSEDAITEETVTEKTAAAFTDVTGEGNTSTEAENGSSGDETQGNEELTGTVYISVSDDADYVLSDGTKSDVRMAYIPVDLTDLSEIDLDDYELGDFKYDKDDDGEYEITMLHLFLYTLDQYYSGGAESAEFSGTPGSMLTNSIWGHDMNLTYYKNGAYPLEKEGWGATADRIVLEDGDFVDLSMYSDWSFYSDTNAGYHYFRNESDEITHEFTATAGEEMTVECVRSSLDVADGYATSYVAAENKTVYYAQEFYSQDAQSAVTDENGDAKITFPSSGTWYIWTKGETGAETDAVVSSPAYAEVTVEEPEITTPSLGKLEVYSNGGGWSKVGDPFEMTPAFNPGTYEGYNVTIPDYLSSVYVDAKVADGFTGYSLMYTNQWDTQTAVIPYRFPKATLRSIFRTAVGIKLQLIK